MLVPSIARKLELSGTNISTSTPEEFRQHIAAETARWRTLIKATGIKLED